MSTLRTSFLCGAAFAIAALSGCGAPEAPEASLTIRGSASAPPRDPSARAPEDADPTPSGDPASLQMGVYALWLGRLPDCSDLVPVADFGATANVVDLAADPVLFSGSPADGAYDCVALRISDVLHVVPATSFGDCVAGQDYAEDLYREGDASAVDIDGTPIVGHGDNDHPVDDRPVVFLSTDPSMLPHPGQGLGLLQPLVVPGQSTFYWDGAGSMRSEAGLCLVDAGRPTFE